MFKYQEQTQEPVKALVFHKAYTEQGGDSNYRVQGRTSQYVVTEHDFGQENGQFVLQPAKEFIDPARFVRILDSMDSGRAQLRYEETEGWVDRNLIYQGKRCVAWLVPEQKRKILFEVHEKKEGSWVNTKNCQTAEIQFLPMLFVKTGKSLSVFLLPKSAKNPAKAKQWKLRVPNLPNVYDTGAVCMGSASVGLGVDSKDRKLTEKGFFESRFTHSNSGERMMRSFQSLVQGRPMSLKEDSIQLKKRGKAGTHALPMTLEDLIVSIETNEGAN